MTESENLTDTWNDESVAAAWSPETSKEDLPYSIYAASKTEGERALWDYVRENHLAFPVNTVLPAANVSFLWPASDLDLGCRLTINSTGPFLTPTFPAVQWDGQDDSLRATLRSLATRQHVCEILDPGQK